MLTADFGTVGEKRLRPQAANLLIQGIANLDHLLVVDVARNDTEYRQSGLLGIGRPRAFKIGVQLLDEFIVVLGSPRCRGRVPGLIECASD